MKQGAGAKPWKKENHQYFNRDYADSKKAVAAALKLKGKDRNEALKKLTPSCCICGFTGHMAWQASAEGHTNTDFTCRGRGIHRYNDSNTEVDVLALENLK